MADRPPVKPSALEGALAWFRRRVAISNDDLDELEESANLRAFRIAGISQLDLANTVLEEIKRAERRGDDLETFKRRTKRKLLRLWGASSPHVLETELRTETQRAFIAGRVRQLSNQSALNLRPFWMFDAVLDSVTSAICRSHNGTIRRHDDPYWRSNTPPLHFNCRSNIRALRRSDAKKRAGRGFPGQRGHDGQSLILPDVNPDVGFGAKPDPQQFAPPPPIPVGRVDDELAAELERKERNR